MINNIIFIISGLLLFIASAMMPCNFIIMVLLVVYLASLAYYAFTNKR